MSNVLNEHALIVDFGGMLQEDVQYVTKLLSDNNKIFWIGATGEPSYQILNADQVADLKTRNLGNINHTFSAGEKNTLVQEIISNAQAKIGKNIRWGVLDQAPHFNYGDYITNPTFNLHEQWHDKVSNLLIKWNTKIYDINEKPDPAVISKYKP